MRVVATAGHVDHGKSSLVRALTGVDPDRLAEERRRGMTIDLGFAWTTLAGEITVAFVDVPGHVDFLRNTIAGVSSARVGLLVVDAGEGWRAQTHEHLTVLGALGIERVVVAVTKVGLAEPEAVEHLRRLTEERVAVNGWPGSPVVPCDSVDRVGMEELSDALVSAVEACPRSVDRGRPRLWIDRSFSMHGIGTVLTGGLGDGPLERGESMVAVTERGVEPARVRGVERLGTAVDRAEPGWRTAVNVGGLHHRRVGRGDVLVRDGEWHLTASVDARVEVSDRLGHPVTRRGAYLAHIGTGAWSVRVQLLGGVDAVEPGAAGLMRLHLPRRLPLLPGDRVVLTETGRAEVIGGGEILDVDPVLRPRRAAPSRSVDRVVAERGWVEADRLTRLTGCRREPIVGQWVVDPPVFHAAVESLEQRISAAGPGGLGLDLLDVRGRALVEHLVAKARCVVENGAVRPPGVSPDVPDSPFLRLLDSHPFNPPDPRSSGVSPQELDGLRRAGLVVSVEGVVFSRRSVSEAAVVIRDRLAAKPEGLTVAEVRDALATTRKWVLPLLAHLDAVGATRRVGELRVAGSRLDQVTTAARGPSRDIRGS